MEDGDGDTSLAVRRQANSSTCSSDSEKCVSPTSPLDSESKLFEFTDSAGGSICKYAQQDCNNVRTVDPAESASVSVSKTERQVYDEPRISETEECTSASVQNNEESDYDEVRRLELNSSASASVCNNEHNSGNEARTSQSESSGSVSVCNNELDRSKLTIAEEEKCDNSASICKNEQADNNELKTSAPENSGNASVDKNELGSSSSTSTISTVTPACTNEQSNRAEPTSPRKVNGEVEESGEVETVDHKVSNVDLNLGVCDSTADTQAEQSGTSVDTEFSKKNKLQPSSRSEVPVDSIIQSPAVEDIDENGGIESEILTDGFQRGRACDDLKDALPALPLPDDSGSEVLNDNSRRVLQHSSTPVTENNERIDSAESDGSKDTLGRLAEHSPVPEMTKDSTIIAPVTEDGDTFDNTGFEKSNYVPEPQSQPSSSPEVEGGSTDAQSEECDDGTESEGSKDGFERKSQQSPMIDTSISSTVVTPVMEDSDENDDTGSEGSKYAPDQKSYLSPTSEVLKDSVDAPVTEESDENVDSGSEGLKDAFKSDLQCSPVPSVPDRSTTEPGVVESDENDDSGSEGSNDSFKSKSQLSPIPENPSYSATECVIVESDKNDSGSEKLKDSFELKEHHSPSSENPKTSTAAPIMEENDESDSGSERLKDSFELKEHHSPSPDTTAPIMEENDESDSGSERLKDTFELKEHHSPSPEDPKSSTTAPIMEVHDESDSGSERLKDTFELKEHHSPSPENPKSSTTAPIMEENDESDSGSERLKDTFELKEHHSPSPENRSTTAQIMEENDESDSGSERLKDTFELKEHHSPSPENPKSSTTAPIMEENDESDSGSERLKDTFELKEHHSPSTENPKSSTTAPIMKENDENDDNYDNDENVDNDDNYDSDENYDNDDSGSEGWRDTFRLKLQHSPSPENLKGAVTKLITDDNGDNCSAEFQGPGVDFTSKSECSAFPEIPKDSRTVSVIDNIDEHFDTGSAECQDFRKKLQCSSPDTLTSAVVTEEQDENVGVEAEELQNFKMEAQQNPLPEHLKDSLPCVAPAPVENDNESEELNKESQHVIPNNATTVPIIRTSTEEQDTGSESVPKDLSENVDISTMKDTTTIMQSETQQSDEHDDAGSEKVKNTLKMVLLVSPSPEISKDSATSVTQASIENVNIQAESLRNSSKRKLQLGSSPIISKRPRILAATEPGLLKAVLKRKLQASPSPEMSTAATAVANVEYKGFKKRYIAQASQATPNSPTVPSNVLHGSAKLLLKGSKSPPKNIILGSQRLVSHQRMPDGTQRNTPLTEYAQYLGLQPTVKFKCYKCGETGFPSMFKLQEHQNTCLKNCKVQSYPKPAPPPSPVDPSPSTNFRITRKVYLCSACGTYYENWNLFLHMREVHKRHICLFCLGMFSQAETLAEHLSTKHSVSEGLYSTSDHFLADFKGSCFLMCCTCERMFSERDNFFDHKCVEPTTNRTCSLCGLRGTHFPTCRQAYADNSSHINMGQSLILSNSSQNLRFAVPEKSFSVTKYLIPVDKVLPGRKVPTILPKPTPCVKEPSEENQDKSRELSDLDEDYDISNAASFCHVNIHEPAEKQKSGVSILKTYARGKIPEPKANVLLLSVPKVTCSPNEIKNTNSAPIKGANVDQEEAKISIASENQAEEPINSCQGDTTSPSSRLEPVSNDNVEARKDDKVEEEEKEDEEEHELKEDVGAELETQVEKVDQKSPKSENKFEDPPKSPKPDTLETDQAENSRLSPMPDVATNAKVSPKCDTNVAAKTHSATDADSETESSDSGGESHDSDGSTSSSDASSDDNELPEMEKRETKLKSELSEESDGDSVDSDKMSLVVDETKSDTEECVNDKEEHSIEENKIANESEEQEKAECDTDVKQDVETDTDDNKPAIIEDDKIDEPVENIQVAGEDAPILELTLEENLDVLSIQMLVKECVKVSCNNCVYCNHAKKIAVNGKQLVLHLLAEHRYEPVVCSDSGELTAVEGFVERLKVALTELEDMYFNTDSYDNLDKSLIRPYDRTYECFHCHFITTIHKELYLHNRKMHQKTILLCIMCKSNFYSYSELLCHLCPGIYVPDSNILFRCCLCVVDGLPSAFRLMVHLRKRHHACDVCLETTGDQQKLSNHVWKHKLHHLCYRCGIAYRNKPDITKHLFWKHGTESVLCKKCLQKKWPHVYHFCIPPNAFVCEECNASFSRAVALKVHKRLHGGDLPYSCEDCDERFISRKLLTRHQDKHKQIPVQEEADDIEESKEDSPGAEEIDIEKKPDPAMEMLVQSDDKYKGNIETNEDLPMASASTSNATYDGLTKLADMGNEFPLTETSSSETQHKAEEKDLSDKKSKVVDVYDLPPLNLSSDSDDSDDDGNTCKSVPSSKEDRPTNPEEHPIVDENKSSDTADKSVAGSSQLDEETTQPVEVVDGIWDNFKTYKANLERRESQHAESSESLSLKISSSIHSPQTSIDRLSVMNVIMAEHDYCGQVLKPTEDIAERENVEPPPQPLLLEQGETDENLEVTKVEEEKSTAFDVDHNYCFNNNTSPNNEEKEKDVHVSPITTVAAPSKKKQKSPKKKQKHSASSSSSDSSSNSDSSSCSCGTNCSCSSSSSSSSASSSSQSSDSDSSSSEGRKRQAARRERRKERTKKKLEESTESTPPVKVETLVPVSSVNGIPQQDEQPISVPAEPEEVEIPIRESDLDTDETETDEDFYDKYPQRQANRLLAEKRNQLLLLAAVAPVNNGTMAQPSQPSSPLAKEPPVKKKVKSKKHKKSQHQHSSSERRLENKLKLNIPASYYNNPLSTFTVTNPVRSASPLINPVNPPCSGSTSQASRTPQETFSTNNPEPSGSSTAYHSTGSGSETDSKRLSKRKRVPKRFYGDSSDEENDQSPQQPLKWRKVVSGTSSTPLPSAQTTPTTSGGFVFKSIRATTPEPVRVPALPQQEDKSEEEEGGEESESEREAKRSSSDSSNSDSDGEKEQDDELSDADSDAETGAPTQLNTAPSSSGGGDGSHQKNENLYCYCQCPYDEVSEMIACDGKDCTIEWFHFECVGIMVPPKGKWFCPDCRKRSAVRSEYLLHT